MNIDHVHFYVEDAWQWQKWLGQKFGFRVINCCPSPDSVTLIVGTATIQFRLSSPLSAASPVADYLRLHPPGVADLGFRVENLAATVQQATQSGAKLLQPIQTQTIDGRVQKCARIQGWGDLQHTLIEREAEPVNLPSADALKDWIGIDHVVLNVAKGDLDHAIDWYEKVLGLQRRQSFAIQTEYSALCSQVLTHPTGSVQFPINQPASSSSQIQEFLDVNRGAGIQHIALRTAAILPTVARLRQQGVRFLPVPEHYYQQLRQRSGFNLMTEWQAIAQQEVLVDWQPQTPQAVLLQAFTQPIFEQPTFFFEIIERRSYQMEQGIKVAEGFGEGNFRALFEAIEREQIKRGSLKLKS